MDRVLKWGLGIFVGLLGILVAAYGFIYLSSQSRINRAYEIDIQAISIPDGPEAIERGRYLVATVGSCVDCHGDDFSGGVFIDDPMVGGLFGANLTAGQGGIGQNYTDMDWVRTIRHGIKPDGTPVLVMPSMDY